MPQLNPNKANRIDGDHFRVKDYDQRENETKKKFTYFYTKQELEEQKAQQHRPLVPTQSNYNDRVGPEEIKNYFDQTPEKPMTDRKTPDNTAKRVDRPRKDINGGAKALVKPKNQGQFDARLVQFSYIQNPDPQTAKEQNKAKDNKEKTQKEEELLIKKALQKKTKNDILEVPEYFNQKELLEFFGGGNKSAANALRKDQINTESPSNRYIDNFNRRSQIEGRSLISPSGNGYLYTPNGGAMDDGEQSTTDSNNVLLEDMFLKSQFQKSMTPNKDRSANGFYGSPSKMAFDNGTNSTLQSKYSRLPNGMIINNDISELKRQNDMLAKINAYIAKNRAKNGEVQMPFGMIDSKSMAEFFSELFSYAPCILKDAGHMGDEFERFKMVVKFGFSILHNLTFQDVFQKKPLMPIIGETFEGHYIYHDVSNVYMESDYVEFEYVDLLSLKDVVVKKELATTYINIEGPKKSYQIYGNLSYDSKWRGNNLIIGLPGVLKVKFIDQEGQDQIIEIQLPDYVLSGYYYIGKPSMILISGPLVVVDKKNSLKSVVLFQGLTKENSLCGVEYIANTKHTMKVVQGLIYKYNKKRIEQYIDKGKTFNISSLSDLFDIEYKLERIAGNAIDYYEIEEIPQSNWKQLTISDPIPCELALPSDIRFREDLIWMKRGEKGKGKVWKGMMKDQFYKDFNQLAKKSERQKLRKKPKRTY